MKLYTSNPDKLAEYRGFGLASLMPLPGDDLREVDGTRREVAIYKALQVPALCLVEDTVLIIDGVECVDIRYRLSELDRLKQPVNAIWETRLSYNDGKQVYVFCGAINGTLQPQAYIPDDAFGFDAHFVPEGNVTSLYGLSIFGEKHLYSARREAVDRFLDEKPEVILSMSEIPEWRGRWQGDPK